MQKEINRKIGRCRVVLSIYVQVFVDLLYRIFD